MAKKVTILSSTGAGNDREHLLSNSFYTLPDNPSDKNFSASQIKSKGYKPSLILFDWISRLASETNEAIDEIADIIDGFVGEIDKIIDGTTAVGRATNDANGNNIAGTYQVKLSALNAGENVTITTDEYGVVKINATAGGGGTGTVQSVNEVEPDENGNVSLDATDIPIGNQPNQSVKDKLDLAFEEIERVEGEIPSTDNLATKTELSTGLAGKLAPSDVVDGVSSTATDKPLSAKQGKVLNERINNLQSIGRFLAVWNCVTGLPTSNPSGYPYTYHTGDYFRVGTVGTTNYMPNGSSYEGTASTTVYSGDIATGDIFFFDGSSWNLQINHASESIQDVKVDGTSVVSGTTANIDLSGKQDVLTSANAGDNISITLVGGVVKISATGGSLPSNVVTTDGGDFATPMVLAPYKEYQCPTIDFKISGGTSYPLNNCTVAFKCSGSPSSGLRYMWCNAYNGGIALNYGIASTSSSTQKVFFNIDYDGTIRLGASASAKPFIGNYYSDKRLSICTSSSKAENIYTDKLNNAGWLANASVADSTLTITKSDGTTVTFEGGGGGGDVPVNMVTIDTYQSITGSKDFTNNVSFYHEYTTFVTSMSGFTDTRTYNDAIMLYNQRDLESRYGPFRIGTRKQAGQSDENTLELWFRQGSLPNPSLVVDRNGIKIDGYDETYCNIRNRDPSRRMTIGESSSPVKALYVDKIITDSSHKLKFGNSYGLYEGSMGLTIMGGLIPETNNVYNLGNSTARWNYIFGYYLGDSTHPFSGIYTTNINGSIYHKTWVGTQAQYDAITTKDANTIYYITEA